jgi:hypothetical protein
MFEWGRLKRLFMGKMQMIFIDAAQSAHSNDISGCFSPTAE